MREGNAPRGAEHEYSSIEQNYHTTKPTRADEPSLVEDLLLMLFRPEDGLRSGTGSIAGEGTLLYVLAGAVLADLGLGAHVSASSGTWGTTVQAATANPPADPLLKETWEYVADKPRRVQTVLAAQGPHLREPVLDRLVERGDIHRSSRKSLGLFTTTVLEAGGTGRRAALISTVRGVLVDGAEPSEREAALTALLYGSGTLPQFHDEIPWTSEVVARAEELKLGNWGAGAAAEAVTRTVTATIVNNVVMATVVLPRV